MTSPTYRAGDRVRGTERGSVFCNRLGTVEHAVPPDGAAVDVRWDGTATALRCRAVDLLPVALAPTAAPVVRKGGGR